MSRTAVALLSTENLRHNATILKQKTNTKIIAMIKANGYGHGIRSVAKRLEGYVDMLGVASIDEALALRKAGVMAPILLIEGVFEPSELLIAASEHFHIVLHNDQQVAWLLRSKLPFPLSVWIKIDTGMGRLGFSLHEGALCYNQLKSHQNVQKPLHVLSHFACADEKNHPLNQAQMDAFETFICQHTDPSTTQYSMLNSAGIFHFPKYAYHYIRPGLALYGISPINGLMANDLDLKPVMTLQSSLIAIKSMTKGKSIGYGSRFMCPEDMVVGVIAFGYGDGYPITAKDGTPVLVNGVQCPLIGRVSMDMMTVDLTPLLKQALSNSDLIPKIGDPVILWGNDLPLEQVAAHTQNLTYDILTGIQNRVRFLWSRA